MMHLAGRTSDRASDGGRGDAAIDESLWLASSGGRCSRLIGPAFTRPCDALAFVGLGDARPFACVSREACRSAIGAIGSPERCG